MSEVPPGESPYPRSPTGAMAPRPPGVYFDCIGEGIQLVKQDVGQWVLTALLALALGYGAVFATNMIAGILVYGSPVATSMTVGGFLLQMVFGFFSTAFFYCMITGMMQMALARVDGRPLDVSVLFANLKCYPQMLIAVTLLTLAIYLGVVLLIIPGVFVAGALALAPMLVARKGLSGMDALKLSWDTLKPHAFPMFGLWFVASLIASVGVIACGVGILFTFPVFATTMALQYRIFFPDDAMDGGQAIGMVPPTY